MIIGVVVNKKEDIKTLITGLGYEVVYPKENEYIPIASQLDTVEKEFDIILIHPLALYNKDFENIIETINKKYLKDV